MALSKRKTLKMREFLNPRKLKKPFYKSQSINFSKRETLKMWEFLKHRKLKNHFKNFSKVSPVKPRNSQPARISQLLQFCHEPKLSQATRTLNLKALSKNRLSFKWRKNMAYNVGSYTQVRIAGDFLSSRNAA